MKNIAVLGSGVVGAVIAYELSRLPGLNITLLDEQFPASGSTGAALGVLMGVISQKTKGRGWRLRQMSLQRYETLIPELEALTGLTIPVNRQGILKLLFAEESLESWENLLKIRRNQGFTLEIWDRSQLQEKCPQIKDKRIIGAIYSPQDRQVNPTLLTQALVAGARLNGVNCQFEVKIKDFTVKEANSSNLRHCYQIQTEDELMKTDWLIIAAGLGSTPLTTSLAQPLDIQPVLGQALHLKLNAPLGNPAFQPVITGDDVHLVPVGKGEYWIGATVEFPNEKGEVMEKPALLEQVRQQAIIFCPELAHATVIRNWSGKRPRPEGQAAPIIGQLPGYDNVLLATGHYRNGVLLAPATAIAIRDFIRHPQEVRE
jgi:glycine/D-amino acid oxidase-like deaminating enzyme